MSLDLPLRGSSCSREDQLIQPVSCRYFALFCVKKICIKFELEYIPFRVFYCECRSNREYKRRCPHFTAKNGGSVGTFFYLEN